MALLAACSFVLQDVNEGSPPDRPPTCSTSYAYSIVDGLITVAGGAGFVYAIRCSGDISCLGQILAGVFIAVPISITYGLSGIYGITRTRRCNRARLLWTEYVESQAPPFIPSAPPIAPPPDAGPPPLK